MPTDLPERKPPPPPTPTEPGGFWHMVGSLTVVCTLLPFTYVVAWSLLDTLLSGHSGIAPEGTWHRAAEVSLWLYIYRTRYPRRPREPS